MRWIKERWNWWFSFGRCYPAVRVPRSSAKQPHERSETYTLVFFVFPTSIFGKKYPEFEKSTTHTNACHLLPKFSVCGQICVH